MEVSKHQRLVFTPATRCAIKRLWPMMGFMAWSVQGHAQAIPTEANKGIAPFANATYTYDSNLLNRSEDDPVNQPQSDQVTRLEVGTYLNYRLERQQFTGQVSFIDNRHQRFKERNTQGNSHRLRWDTEIGKTLTGSLEGSSISDQAPIQTGQVTAIKRDQDKIATTLDWNFHPNFAVVSEYNNIETRFEGQENSNNSVLEGLNREDELRSVGVAYQPGTGSTTALLFKESTGDFPARQIVGPGQTVSNNFEQSEVEWLTKWNYSAITRLTLSLSSVKRQHEEIQSRDFSGTNYRVEVFYKPTVKTNFTASYGKQIVGVSDATNSDALARQLILAMNMELTSKVKLQLAYVPQQLQFNGTDGFNTVPRTDRLKELIAGLEFKAAPKVTLGANLRKRDRDSTLANTDYSAYSMNVFARYEY